MNHNEPQRTMADADRLPEAKGDRSPEALDDQAFALQPPVVVARYLDGQQRLQAATVLLARWGELTVLSPDGRYLPLTRRLAGD